MTVFYSQPELKELSERIVAGRLNRSDEEIAVYDEVARRFGDSNSSAIIEQVAKALIAKGIKLGQLDSPAAKRAADLSACERDFSTILSILPRNDALLGPSIHALVVFSAHLGPKRALELIENSPAAEMLLPLVTAIPPNRSPSSAAAAPESSAVPRRPDRGPSGTSGCRTVVVVTSPVGSPTTATPPAAAPAASGRCTWRTTRRTRHS